MYSNGKIYEDIHEKVIRQQTSLSCWSDETVDLL